MRSRGLLKALCQQTIGGLVAAVCAPAMAATVNVGVVDEQGHALERVAVYALPNAPTLAGATIAAAPTGASSVAMDQQDNAFVPHILVVQKGASVIFPNHDNVSHHVYSFSPAKTFELGLYKGNTHAPVLFEQAGLVVLGCNIHDGMLGYILVVDTPYFGTTDERGSVKLDGLPEGSYTVHLWTPRARANQLPAGVLVDTAAVPRADVKLEILGKLLPDHDHPGSGLSWVRY
jgi:plastocyanin